MHRISVSELQCSIMVATAVSIEQSAASADRPD